MQHSQVEKNMLPALMTTPPQKCQWPSISSSSSSCPTPSNQGLTLPTKYEASHISEGRLAGLKTLLTKHILMGTSQRVYFTGISVCVLVFLILPPWAGHRKSLISFSLFFAGTDPGASAGTGEMPVAFSGKRIRPSPADVTHASNSAPPFISHITPCSATKERRKNWPLMPICHCSLMPLKALCGYW